MSFYLLKSDFKRQYVGDVLIDKDQVESIGIKIKDHAESDKPIFVMKVSLKSGDSWNGVYKSLETAKSVAKEILGERIDDASLNDLLPEK